MEATGLLEASTTSQFEARQAEAKQAALHQGAQQKPMMCLSCNF